MQDNSFYFDPDSGVEDISSSSGSTVKRKPQKSGPIANYGNGIFKNLGSIIKMISFFIAFAILAVSFVAAFFLFSKDSFFMAISLGILIFGIVVAAITMFIIYGIGHVICQNNEILRQLREYNDYR